MKKMNKKRKEIGDLRHKRNESSCQSSIETEKKRRLSSKASVGMPSEHTRRKKNSKKNKSITIFGLFLTRNMERTSFYVRNTSNG